MKTISLSQFAQMAAEEAAEERGISLSQCRGIFLISITWKVWEKNGKFFGWFEEGKIHIVIGEGACDSPMDVYETVRHEVYHLWEWGRDIPTENFNEVSAERFAETAFPGWMENVIIV